MVFGLPVSPSNADTCNTEVSYSKLIKTKILRIVT